MNGMKELTERAHHCPITNAALNHWRMSSYPSFEAALIDLVCILGDKWDEALRFVHESYWKNPSSPATEKEKRA